MIEVERLSKRYGGVQAVDRLTFAIGRGEVVGFLGPNGAGKTTTMRLLTTYLAPTSGRARVAGNDLLDDPRAVRRHVGYLPENVPLYAEMRVREYLDYRARLKDVPRSRRRGAIGRVLERCRIADVEDRIIGHLSRGYRQRVGLADALVHDPDVLILDEPTAGLDPIQVQEVRGLIREVGSRHTVLLSTHIMSEVEVVCGRVLILARGRVRLDAPLDDLRRAGDVVVEARGPAEAVRRAIEATPGVARAAAVGRDGDWGRFEVHARDGHDPREALAARLVRDGHGVRLVDLRRSTLEERFLQVVGEAHREGEAA